MTRVGDESWFINSVVGNSGEETSITVTHPRLKTQPWAYNTLEGYGVGDCSYEPTKPCLFTNLVLTSNGQTVGGALDACLLATALSSPTQSTPLPPTSLSVSGHAHLAGQPEAGPNAKVPRENHCRVALGRDRHL